jgi:hypothetical protein
VSDRLVKFEEIEKAAEEAPEEFARDHRKYLGMDMHQAHAYASAAGEQLRVMSHNGRSLRYAEPPEPEHILVWIQSGFITKAS